MEIDELSFNIEYRPGKSNVAAEDISHVYFTSVNSYGLALDDLHEESRLLHFVRSTNLPFSTEDVKKYICVIQSFCWVKTSVLSTFWR